MIFTKYSQSLGWTGVLIGHSRRERLPTIDLAAGMVMRRVIAAALILLSISAGCSNQTDRALDGTGSTFVAPLMSKWKERYQTERGVKITYESVGSGVGIDRLLSGQFDFACTDAPLSDEQVNKARQARSDVVHIPLTLGAVVPAYNLEGYYNELILNGPVLADIYLGKITKWNDSAIQDLNKGVKLPEREIVVVHRAESSGTTFIWTDYLAKVSPEWKKKVGAGSSVTWPVGLGQMGNKAVAAKIRSTPNSIGYVPLGYARQNELAVALVKNRAGIAVKADSVSVTAAAEASMAQIPDDLRCSITDAPGNNSYPISGTTWAVVFVQQSPAKGRALVDFLRWATRDGQTDAEALHFVRLPPGIVERLGKKLELITVK
jgi:phosphate transport system substrate-binding protein